MAGYHMKRRAICKTLSVKFALVLLPILVFGCIKKAKFAGGANYGARDPKVIESTNRTIETTRKHNLWVVTRQEPQKQWSGLSASNWSNKITVPDITGVTVGMSVRGPGLDSDCDDPTSEIFDCPTLYNRGILSIDPSTKTLTLAGRIRFYSTTKKTDLSNVSSEHGLSSIVLPDVTNLSVGDMLGGPGLDQDCEDVATTTKDCPGRAVITSIDVANSKVTLDRVITHLGGTKGQVKSGLTYSVYTGSFTGNYVLTTGVAHWIQLEGDKVLQHKKWTGIDGLHYDLGARTYVTEGGFLVARFPFAYFIDPENTPEGVIPSSNIKNFDPKGAFRWDSRMCLASYFKNDKRYMIAALGAGKYYEIPMNDTKPYKPLWDDLDKIPLRQLDNSRGDEAYFKALNPPQEGIGWGYSCHINQKKKIFYSQWVGRGPKFLNIAGDPTSSWGGAVDLNTYKTVDLDTQIPNAKFVQNHPVLKSFALSVSSPNGSYSVAGDPDGNIYNADRDADLPPIMGKTVQEKNRAYTMAYEKLSDTIWVTRTDMSIGVIKRKCLTTEPNCTDNDFWFGKIDLVNDPSNGIVEHPGAWLGPISALRDGRMAVVSRPAAPLVVRILSLKDPKDISKGVDVLPIMKLDGDPYMYVDFTGATLYTRESEQTFKIMDIPGYAGRWKDDPRPDKVLEAYFEWKNIPDTQIEWKDMKLEARCYTDASNKGNYSEIAVVANAGEKTLLDIPSCKGQYVDSIDIKITQIKGETLGDVESVKIHIKQ